MPTKVLTESYQWQKPSHLNKAELQRLERHFLDNADKYSDEGMYANAWGCKSKAEVIRDLIRNYDWEEK